MFAALGVEIIVSKGSSDQTSYTCEDFLDQSMDRRVITKVLFPYLNDRAHFLKCHKVCYISHLLN